MKKLHLKKPSPKLGLPSTKADTAKKFDKREQIQVSDFLIGGGCACQIQENSRHSGQSSMLVRESQIFSLKIQYLVNGYQQLLDKLIRSQNDFQIESQRQLTKHKFYFQQILLYVRETEHKTQDYLLNRFEKIRSDLTLMARSLQMKLFMLDKNRMNFQQKESRRSKPYLQPKQHQLSQLSSKGEINFQAELQELYRQSDLKIQVKVQSQSRIQDSLLSIKKLVIKDWQRCIDSQKAMNSSMCFSDSQSNLIET